VRLQIQNKRRQMRKNKIQGFTLVELVTVVAVIAILSAVAYPSYQESIRKAKRAEGRAALMQLMQQEERFYSQATTYIAFSATSTDANAAKFKWWSGAEPKSSSYEISASACLNDVIQNCVLLTARPGTERVNSSYQDPTCADFMLSSTGVKTVSGSGVNCW